MSKKKVTIILSLIAIFLFAGIFGTTSTNAASDYGQLAAQADLHKCYFQNAFLKEVDITTDLVGPGTVIGNEGVKVALPNTKSSDGEFSCSVLLDSHIGTGFDPKSSKSKEEYLLKLGYKPASSGGGTKKKQCGRIKFYMHDGASGKDETMYTNNICAFVDNNGIATDNYFAEETAGDFLKLNLSRISEGIISGGTAVNELYVTGAVKGSNLQSILNEVYSQIMQVASPEDGSISSSDGRFYYPQGVDYPPAEDISEAVTNTYVLDAPVQAYYKAAQSFFGSNFNYTFGPTERQALFNDYLSQYFEAQCEWMDGATEITDSKGNKVYVKYIENAGKPTTFYIPSSSGEWYETVDPAGFISALSSAGIEITGVGECTSGDPPTHQEGEYGTYDEEGCFNGANSLGWIVCPIITALRETMDVIYQSVIEPFLQIDVTVFKTEGNSIYSGWQIFQGFANIAFVILLLVVVFSQVTGIGIDNLGIKRILPKLIVAAVLINLSYIICQLLVDISNISGYGLRSLFDSIPIQAPEAEAGESLVATLISGAIGGAAIGTAAATFPMWAPFVILPLLLGLISILISVLFMFILLGVRQAGVIILVVVSPLAFVFYMLPNTKPIFQRWWKALTGLLLLFPICGAMIGGSALAGRIIASTSTDFWPNLLAALITVVPFFFVPTLLKGSFSALGNIGAKISGVGSKIGGGLGRLAGEGVKRTGAFKNIQANAKDREELRSRVAERRRLEGITNRIGNISAGMRTPEQQLQYARAQAALEKMNDEDMFSNPELIQSEAASKRFNRQVEAMKSKNVASGMVNRIGEVDGKSFDGTGNGFTDNTLAYSLYNAADDVERYAITSQLMASGHHGAEALHQVMTALGNDGNTAALAAIAAAAKGDSKLGDLKSGARSTYDYINDLAEGKIKAGAVGTGGNISDYVTGAHDADHEGRQVNFGGMSEQQLVNTDKEELRRYEQVIAQKRARGEELNNNEKKLVAQATAAWNNERIRGSAKKDIQDTISRIAFGEVKTPGAKGGDKKGNAIENEIVDIRGGESEPGPIPTQTPVGGESDTGPVSSGSTGGGSSATGSGGGSTISYDDSAQEAFANAQQAVNEDRIARERTAREEARRAEMKSYDMDEATYEMMNAQQGVEQDKANRSANRETARSSRFNRRGPNPYNSESGNKS